MELESTLDTFEEQGIGVVAISYDTRHILEHFAERMGGLRYALLADPESQIIRAFGILNVNVPEDSPAHGIPFPGTYLVDADGVVKEKYFDEIYTHRFTAETVILKTYGIGGGKRTEVETKQFKLAAYASQDTIRPGNRIMLTVEIELPEGMHLYAPGEHSYRGVDLRVAENESLQIFDVELPEPEVLYLPAIKEKVPVYHDKVTLTRDVTLTPRYQDESLRLETVLGYQTCDAEICFPPAEMPLVFELEVEPFDRERVPEELRKARPSS